ncbi:MAG: M56 family metallopeptidase [Acidobacteriota bacterium]
MTISATLIQALGWTLIHFLWQGAMVVGLTACALELVDKRSARLRYAFGCIGMLLLVAAPLVTFSREYAAAASLPALADYAVPQVLDMAKSGASATVERSREFIGLIRGSSPAPAAPIDWRGGISEVLSPVLPALVLFWTIGVALLSLRVVRGTVGVWRMRTSHTDALPAIWERRFAALAARMDVKRRMRILQSSLAEVPAVIGVIRPVILIPASALSGLSTEQLEMILAHEIAHVRRLDYLVNLLQTLVETMFFYHPAVWWISNQIRIERENCCDDAALAVCGNPVLYARALAELETLRGNAPAPAIAATGGSLIARIRRVLANDQEETTPAPVAGVAILAVILIVILAPFSVLAGRATNDGVRHSGVVESLVRLVVNKSTGVTPAKPEVASVASDDSTDKEWNDVVIDRTDNKTDRNPADFGGLKEAIEVVSNRLTGDRQPALDDGAGWYRFGYALHNKDQFDDARAAFERAIQLGAKVPESSYNIACGYALQNDHENALLWLRKAIDAGYDSRGHMNHDSDLDRLRTDPRFAQLMQTLPSDNKDTGDDRLTEANDEFSRLKRSDSKEGGDWFGVGFDLISLGDYPRAIDAFQHALQYGFKESTTMYNLACAYSLNGNRDEGMRWLTKAVENGFDNSGKLDRDPDIQGLRSDPRFPALRQRADALSLGQFMSFDKFMTAHWQKAVDHFRSVVQSDNCGRSWFNLGYSLHENGQYGEAISAYQQALSKGYRIPTTTYNVACSYARLGDRENAFVWLDRAANAGMNEDVISGDDDLNSLHSDPRFEKYRKDEPKKFWKDKKKEQEKRSKVSEIVQF